jgi:hypothetical protein
MTRSLRLSRRAVLRGAAGATLALPWLECMPMAKAQAMPRRYALLFAGQSIGGDGYAHDAQRINGANLKEDGHFIAPDQTGTDYTPTTPLMPLMALRDEFTLISNLSIPFNANASGPVPAGGAFRDFHGGAAGPLLCGTRSEEAAFRCRSITSDQVIAELNAGTTALPSLVLRAQPAWYLSGSEFAGRQYISYDRNAGRIEAQASPQVAYGALFGNFTPPDEQADPVKTYRSRARRSVLDFIAARRKDLIDKVGSSDKQRLERHFDEIRDLELRIAALGEVGGGACVAPSDPGADPAVGGNNAGSGSDSIGTNTGYSDEDTRARLMADLIHMAFVCDLTRAASLQITVFQSHMNVASVSSSLGLPMRADLHEVGHNGDQDNRGQLAVSTMLRWHISHYAYLLEKLRGTSEGGVPLLDHTTVVFLPEGGHGTQLNDGVTPNQTHSVENMVALVGGGRAHGLRLGHHLRAANGTHPGKVLLSAMRAAGYAGDTFGEVQGQVDDLFV